MISTLSPRETAKRLNAALENNKFPVRRKPSITLINPNFKLKVSDFELINSLIKIYEIDGNINVYSTVVNDKYDCRNIFVCIWFDYKTGRQRELSFIQHN